MHLSQPLPQGIAISGPISKEFAEILSPEALGFLAKLHRKFESRPQELLEHSAGLNIGRWDYIFSCIKKFRANQDFCLADHSQVT